ncbi:MAG: carboxypeptidase regulatory-like domain-containing protein, partial [Chloroflexota bacterium]|nr:carboxypeptidase regulatory-like domain-containing protein [Chloroflexota bacterium]
MSLQDSPSLDKFQDGLDTKRQVSGGGKKPLTWVILTLVVAVAILGVINLVQSGAAAQLRGTGTITGQVVDEQNHPLQADVIIMGTKVQTETDAEGYFTLSDVPADTQSIVIGYQGAAHEYPLSITAGETTN